MSKDALLKWKARIFKHQQRTLNTEPPQQTSLFDPPRSYCDSDAINPETTMSGTLTTKDENRLIKEFTWFQLLFSG